MNDDMANGAETAIGEVSFGGEMGGVKDEIVVHLQCRAADGRCRHQRIAFLDAGRHRLFDQRVDAGAQQRLRHRAMEGGRHQDMRDIDDLGRDQFVDAGEALRDAAVAREPLRPLADDVDDGGDLDSGHRAESRGMGVGDVAGADKADPLHGAVLPRAAARCDGCRGDSRARISPNRASCPAVVASQLKRSA